MPREEGSQFSYPLNFTLSAIGIKWKPYIIWHLAMEREPVSFDRVREIIPYTITRKLTAQCLKELVSDGIAIRSAIPNEDHPEQAVYLYQLTPKGYSLYAIMRLMNDWGLVNGPFNGNSGFRLAGQRYRNKILYPACPDWESPDGSEAFVWMRNIGAATDETASASLPERPEEGSGTTSSSNPKGSAKQ